MPEIPHDQLVAPGQFPLDQLCGPGPREILTGGNLPFPCWSSASYNEWQRRIVRHYNDCDTDELRRMAWSTGPDNYWKWTRKMLLALFHNRYPHGTFIEVYEGDAP